MTIRVGAVATAVPDYVVSQAQARDLAARLFRNSLPDLDRLLPVFENTLIRQRRFSRPLEWFTQPHTFPECNAIYETTALELCERAAREALARAGVEPETIGLIVVVSTTGLCTPSLDARLIPRLGLRRDAHRLPIWGLGCAGGVAGLARAWELARGTGRPALLLAVELCSLTFQSGDRSKANLVAASLFGDGAAAVVLVPDGAGPELLGAHSTLLDDSEDVMGWDLVESGLKVRFSRDIPALIRERLPGWVAAACRDWNIAPSALRHFVLHPGGARVLVAYAEGLGLTRDQFGGAYTVLADYGNMSSPSVLFVLAEFLRRVPPENAYGLMLALGPGFSAEQLLFRW